MQAHRWLGTGPRSWVALLAVLVFAMLAMVVTARSTGNGEARRAQYTPPVATPGSYLGIKPVRSDSEVIVGAAGDIACGSVGRAEKTPDTCEDAITAELLGSVQPDAVTALGDVQYPNGSLVQFQNNYDLTWGRFKDVTYPVPGNHEYDASDATGYFDYFGADAGPRDAGYYSYDLGAWHVVALNSECDRVGGCTRGSPQEEWLRADLAAHPARCTLVYWHKPRFSSGFNGSDMSVDGLWRASHAGGADLVLAAHDHDYERFIPLGPDGQADPERGMRQFVVGTGGHSFLRFHTIAPGSEVRIAGTAGIVKLVLRPDRYEWEFVTEPEPELEPDAGAGDTGSGTCR